MLQTPQFTLSILDPTSLLGREIAELVASTFPAARRKLFHTTGKTEHAIAEIAGEAALVPPFDDPEELSGSDAVVVTASPKPASATALLSWLRAHPRVILIDATQPGMAGDEATPALDSPRPTSGARWYQMVDPALVAPVPFLAALSPLEPKEVHLTVLMSVASFGEEALKDLAGQAAARLSGRPPQRGDRLPGVLAFDASPTAPARRQRLERQLTSLIPGIKVRLHLIQAGIFHGHAATVLVRCQREAKQKELLGLIRDGAGIRLVHPQELLCLSGVVGDEDVVCADLAAAGEWVSAWLAADGLHIGGAKAVVDLLSALRAS